MERKTFEKRFTIRLFEEERSLIKTVVLHAKDDEGFRKYESPSHFIRACVINRLRDEFNSLDINKGRPKKYTNGVKKWNYTI